ncbi:hypothetical protein EXIGLDRAFT_734874 [Exidia glandulosa HHB12029]|uniref:Carboxymuconolactone decarboxylase-like domain-containing protein n=1 Tax=Exidia glandulosa HHB12029 TaxID=1314781 RepID=A0A165K1J0_EXIGL|nr:hypothetical protein EXIGLDRAFT_734874 [Exidia glandulosa HHB12029]
MSTPNPATPELLAHLASLLPENWYIPASVAFTAAGVPEALPTLYAFAAEGCKSEEEKVLLVRRIRDAVFKGGILTGYARAINALLALHESLPPSLQASSGERPIDTVKMDDVRKRGKEFFEELYGPTAKDVQGLLDGIYPDLGFFSSTIAYGLVYGGTPELHTTMESSFVQIAALVAGDTPRQVGWHLANVRRIGATKEQASAVREIALEVGRACGVRWRSAVPEVPE